MCMLVIVVTTMPRLIEFLALADFDVDTLGLTGSAKPDGKSPVVLASLFGYGCYFHFRAGCCQCTGLARIPLKALLSTGDMAQLISSQSSVWRPLLWA